MRPLRLLASAGLLSALAFSSLTRAQDKPDRFAVEAPFEFEAPRSAAGACAAAGTASSTLTANDVVAGLHNSGGLFYDPIVRGGDGYVVPAASGRSPIFAASLWVGGKVDGEVRTAASRYSSFEFVPGPAGSGLGCEALDRIYTVSVGDLALYAATGTAAPDLRDWPTGLGAPTVDAAGAPVVPTSPEQIVDLTAGQWPTLSGGQTAFWVMNDLGPHPTTRSAPLGIEVQVTAFAAPSADPAVNQATIYRYRLVNRGAAPITDAHASLFVDVEIGGCIDDYVGTDVGRGMAYAYNGDNDDEGSCSALGYGPNPPAAGADLLTGAGASSYYINSNSSATTGDPLTPVQFDRNQHGIWNDGTAVRAYGDGYNQTQGVITRYAFPGDPVTGQGWSEVNNGSATPINAVGDRRMAIHTPAFSLAVGESRDVDVAVLFTRGSSNLDSITRLRVASDAVQARFDSGALFASTPLPSVVSAPVPAASDPRPASRPPTLTWAPSVSGQHYRVETSRSLPFSASTTIRTYIAESASFEFPDTFLSEIPANDTTSVFWRVRVDDLLGGAASAPSAARRFVTYRYEPGPLLLSDGSPAFVEVAAPGGGPPCTTGAFGCAEVGGAFVYNPIPYTRSVRVNSTGQYAMSAAGQGPEAMLARYVPNEFEIRFTPGGSLAYHQFTTGRISRVPFEVWDVGKIVPGASNDPSDDVQMVPVVAVQKAGTDECVFEFGDVAGPLPLPNPRGSTPRIYAYYPTTTYADWAAASKATSPEACPVRPATDAAAAFIDQNRRPIQRILFQAAGSTQSVSELQGTVVRFYTLDGDLYPTAAETPAGPVEALRLGAPAPNPTRGVSTLAYDVPATGPVRLEIYDVLGRRVATLADGDVPAGRHEARLDGRSLAPGVYVVRLTAGGRAVSRLVTVVR